MALFPPSLAQTSFGAVTSYHRRVEAKNNVNQKNLETLMSKKSSTEFYCRTVLMLKMSVTLTLAVKRHRFVIFNISARPGALDALRPGHLRPKV